MLDACHHRDACGLRALRPGDGHGEDSILEVRRDLVSLDLSGEANLPVHRVEIPLAPDVGAARDLVLLVGPTDRQDILIKSDLDVLRLEARYGRLDFEGLVALADVDRQSVDCALGHHAPTESIVVQLVVHREQIRPGIPAV